MMIMIILHSSSIHRQMHHLLRSRRIYQHSNTSFSTTRTRTFTKDERDIIQIIPGKFLRSNDETYVDKSTYQRVDVHFDKKNGKPIRLGDDNDTGGIIDSNKQEEDRSVVKNASYDSVNDRFEIQWKDGHISFFDSKWVETQMKKRRQPSSYANESTKRIQGLHPSLDLSTTIPRMPWSNMTEKDIRCESQNHHIRFDFSEVVHRDDTILQKAVQSLFQYGILFITSTPTSDNGAGVAALASALSGPAHKLSPETTLMAHYLDYHNEKNKESTSSYNNSPPSLSSILERGTDGPQRTMYGNVWYTNASSMVDGTSTADSAYGNDALPLHTDFTYFRDPPGLQIFTMVHPAQNGGESIFADGLAIAEYMRMNHPKEFDTLCRVRRRYRSVDVEHGWYLEGSGPVIEAIDLWEGLGGGDNVHMVKGEGQRWGPVVGIRHNDLDRLPDLPPNIKFDDQIMSEVGQQGHVAHRQTQYDEEFYQELEEAHKVWDGLLGRDEFRLVIALNAGDTAVVANQRCMHGRCAFRTEEENPRSVMGCYVSQDDLESRIRWMLNGNCIFK